jgi:hypothetical protein
LTEEQARLYELAQPSELLEGLAIEAVGLTVHDCCAMLQVMLQVMPQVIIIELELIDADIR